MTAEIIKVQKVNVLACIPELATSGSSGMDLKALEDTVVFPGDTVLVKTGLAFQIPHGYEMQLRPRSGLSRKYPNYISNSPATIDSDYRGEVQVIVTNFSNNPLRLEKGDRFVQAVIAPVLTPILKQVSELDDTERGAGGFGSTGR